MPILNGLVGLVQGSGEQPLEVEVARSGAFMAIFGIGTDGLWAPARAR